MKNWSTTTKWVVAIVVVIAIVAIYMNWSKISSMWGSKSSDGTTTKQRGGCVKHVGTNGYTWYTYGGVEVAKQDCIDRGYL